MSVVVADMAVLVLVLIILVVFLLPVVIVGVAVAAAVAMAQDQALQFLIGREISLSTNAGTPDHLQKWPSVIETSPFFGATIQQ